MLDRLKKHHLGFVITGEEKTAFESRYQKKFVYDPIQETHVLFVFEKELDLFLEYIVKEGRVKNHKPGFAHICYEIDGKSELDTIRKLIEEKSLGFEVTKLEKSACEECDQVTFYYLKNFGLVEFNVVNGGAHSKGK